MKQSTRLAHIMGTLLWLLTAMEAAALPALCESEDTVSVHCGSTPSAVFDSDNRHWVAFVQNQHVYVSYSDNRGLSYSKPVAVNSVAEDAEHNGENRPKILVDDTGVIYVSWTLKTSPRFTGEIRFSRSLDNGASFEAPRTINDDKLFAGHRFESLFLTESGHLYLVWIDKRDLEAHLARDEEYGGAAIYYAVSEDRGATFSTNSRVADHSCECCRIAIAPNGTENIAILWRQIFGETTRDHAIAILTPEGNTAEMHRASYDEWQINACPHHGPTMVQSAKSGDYHMSWFSNGDRHQGTYYGRFSFADKQAHDVFRVDGNPGAGHPFLAESGNKLYLVWKGFDGSQSLINLITSTDDGRTWSQAQTLFTTVAASDYPLIVQHEEGLYLSWHSDEFGYVFTGFSDELRSTASD
ncbi:MAG: sialidase family protein [Proteobacteria bacterium]|jgi:hypothetical protein|nr:sialidase family protein [Pseudomonadota bacterium]MDA0928679.1 sialidase family protein [Pseudomonadota bacterium]